MARSWIRTGLIGIAMVSLGCAGSLVGFMGWAAATGPAQLLFPATPYPRVVASADPEIVARGRYLVHGPAHCVQCHSTTDRNDPGAVRTTPLHGGLAFEMGPIGTLYARNLTSDATTGLARRTDAEVARVLKSGVLADSELSIFMRYSASALSDEDIVAVLSYLRTVEPVSNEVPDRAITPIGWVFVKFAFGAVRPRDEVIVGVQASEEPTVERGRYLVENVMVCTACHSEVDMATFQIVGPRGGGGMAEASHGDDSDMEFRPPNLTSHPTGITGKLDEDAFVARLLAGRTVASSIMPWEGFQDTTEGDLRSVYRYLRSLPPVDLDTGPPYRKVGWTP